MAPIIGIIKAYIALLGAEICDIGSPFPKFIASRHLANPSPQSSRTKTFLYFLYELLTSDSNTSNPLVVTSVVTVRQ
ncbi:MAG: hypothetical protein ACNY01_06375 [Desulfobacteria bacterium]